MKILENMGCIIDGFESVNLEESFDLERSTRIMEDLNLVDNEQADMLSPPPKKKKKKEGGRGERVKSRCQEGAKKGPKNNTRCFLSLPLPEILHFPISGRDSNS